MTKVAARAPISWPVGGQMAITCGPEGSVEVEAWPMDELVITMGPMTTE
jgi:hypothetical protein